jgi:adenosylcobinamide-phosphate synthase
MQSAALILALALLTDRFIGDPEWLWGRIAHPVVIFGKALGLADTMLNADGKSVYQKRRDGFLAVLALLLASALTGWAVHFLLMRFSVAGLLAESAIVSIFLAQKSLADHVAAVAAALAKDGLAGGRRAVSKIVGRDPDELDEAAVCRAAIESLAENSSDGVAAPAFWYLIGGLPGLLAYKMLNTADSMIGHMSERHRDFGRFAAKLDDAANWLPARLTGGLIALAAFALHGRHSARAALTVMMRDARLHASPNAGWPEAAMAGALGLSLGGPREYGGDFVNAPVLNGAGRRNAGAQDIQRAIAHFWTAMTILTLLSGIFYFL